MKNLSLVVKMAKATDIKRLQQHLATLQTQQQKRIDKVVELQPEAKKVTGIIQPVHEKVRQALGSIGLTNS